MFEACRRERQREKMRKSEGFTVSCSSVWEARLWFKVASRMRVLVSLVRSDDSSSRTRRWVEAQEAEARDGHHKRRNGESGKRQKGRARTGVVEKDGCYLCSYVFLFFLFSHIYSQLIVNDNSDTQYRIGYKALPPRKQTPSLKSNATTPTSTRSSSSRPTTPITYLPLSHTQPPRPPQRSTSLPHYLQLQKLHLSTAPRNALVSCPLTRRESLRMSYLVSVWQDGLRGTGRLSDPIWRYVVQVSASSYSMRRLALCVCVALVAHPLPVPTQSQKHTNAKYLPSSEDLAFLRVCCATTEIDTRTHEIAFLATYLLACLAQTQHQAPSARFWLRQGYRVLRAAMIQFCSYDFGGDGLALPGNMRNVALAFGRLPSIHQLT